MMVTELKDIMTEVKTTYTELRGRVDDLDKENKRLGEEIVSKGGSVPAEYKNMVDTMNTRMDDLLEKIKDVALEKGRSDLFNHDSYDAQRKATHAFLRKYGVQPLLADHESNAMANTGTQSFLKMLRGQKAFNGGLMRTDHMAPEDLTHVDYKHMAPEVKALYAGDAVTGGYFASVDFRNDLQAYQILISPMRQVAQVIQVSGEKAEWPNLIGDTSAYYAQESNTYTQSGDPTLGMLNIPVHEMRAYLQLSQQNMEDSMFPLESFLKQRIALKFAQREGTAFIRGTGQGQPRGIMAYNGVQATSQAYNATATPTGKQTGLTYIPYIPSGQAATLGQGDCLILALQDLKQVYADSPSCRWCLTRTSVGVLRLIKDSQNRPLWQPFAGEGLPATIYDIGYITMPDMDEVAANNFPIIIGDFKNYLIADRAGVNFAVRQLDELFALQGLVGFIARNRHGGDVLIPEAFRAIRVATT
jgi:HK97 family phage major capsid protein